MLPVPPKAVAPPNGKPPWPEEAVDDAKAGVELGCWPNTDCALGFTPKAGAADGVAVKEDAADPKEDTVDCAEPNAGVCPEPKPEVDVVAVNPNAAEGAGAVVAGVEAAPPKEKGDVFELFPTPKTKGGAGLGATGASAGAGWVSCCCPNMKLLEAASEEELWPKLKVLLGAGVGARLELLGVPKRLGARLEEAGVVDEPLIKANEGFGAALSVAFCPKPNVGFGVSVGSAGFPNANGSLGSSFGGSGLLKLKPTEGAGLSASLAALNTNPVEGIEISFFSSGCLNMAVVVEVFHGVSSAKNSSVVTDSVTGDLPKTGTALAVAETASVEGGGSSFSALALGADKLNDGFDPVFSSGFESPNAKPPDAALVAAVLVASEPKLIALLPPNLKPAPEF